MKPVALLTGGSTGIGSAILAQLLPQFRVAVIGRSRPAQLPLDSCEGAFFQADLSDLSQAAKTFAGVRESSFGSPEVLISNAGFGVFAPLEDLSPVDWQNMLNVNVTALFLLLQAFLPAMRQRNFGKVVVITSDADSNGFARGAGYCASKHAALGLCEAVRSELVGTGIALTVLAPGRVDTNFNGKKVGDRPTALHANDVASQVQAVLTHGRNCDIERITMRSTLEMPA